MRCQVLELVESEVHPHAEEERNAISGFAGGRLRSISGGVSNRWDTLTTTRCVVAAQTPPVIASNPCWMFTTRLPSMGGASIHAPFLLSTCSPPVSSCERKVKSPVESLCGPTPWDSGGACGYLMNFKRSMLPLNFSKVSGGNERHSATERMKACDSAADRLMYSSTSSFAPGW